MLQKTSDCQPIRVKHLEPTVKLEILTVNFLYNILCRYIVLMTKSKKNIEVF